jgi:hypothetical protein
MQLDEPGSRPRDWRSASLPFDTALNSTKLARSEVMLAEADRLTALLHCGILVQACRFVTSALIQSAS